MAKDNSLLFFDMSKILKYYTRIILFLLPIFFLPVVIDIFGFGKSWFLTVSAMIGIVIWVLDLLLSKKEKFKYGKILGLALLVLAWTTVLFLRLPVGVRMRSFFNPYGFGTIIGMVGWVFLWLQTSDKEEGREQLKWLTAAGILVAVGSLVAFLLPASKLPIVWPKDNPIVSINSNWSLTGSVLTEMFLFLFLGLIWFGKLMRRLKTGEYISEAVVTAMLVLVLAVDGYKVYKTGLTLLDWNTAWVVAAETFKRLPIFGVGVGNFVEAFNQYRPTAYNLTKYWTNSFNVSRSGLLQIWTEWGTVGLLLVLIPILNFALANIRNLKKNGNWIVGLMFVIFVFFPMDILYMFILMWFLVWKAEEKKEIGLVLKIGEGGFNAMPYVVAMLLLAGVAYNSWWEGRVLLGEAYMRQSLVAAGKNDGSATYNLQIKAIGINPYMADYRRSYSQTNMALAGVLLANKEIGDEDKQKATVLVQQGVREAKAAISLDTINPIYWINLANVYRQLFGVVQGAEDWSFQALQQAVAVDPINPVTRLDMGGLLYASGRYDEADREFEKVVVSKQNFPNGWYNWAYSAKKMNKIADAIQRLTQAVALVSIDSGDYEKASKELVDWKKEYDDLMKKQGASASALAPKPETLKTPEVLPTGGEERVNVPAEELEPPKVSPIPTETQVAPSSVVTPTE